MFGDKICGGNCRLSVLPVSVDEPLNWFDGLSHNLSFLPDKLSHAPERQANPWYEKIISSFHDVSTIYVAPAACLKPGKSMTNYLANAIFYLTNDKLSGFPIAL